MKTLTVLELSKLYNINRQTIYNHIKKGILSKNSENKIDLAEAIRVFGEPIKKQDVKEPVKIDSPSSAEVLLLRQQIDMLKNQLSDAKDRESFYQNQIETMQRLLEAPKPNTTQSGDSGSVQSEPTAEVIAMPPKESEIIENKRIPVPEHVEPEPEKRGFWSRFFKPYG
ncbi:DNA-binding protein (plasmid) [Acinetobacter indicus]|uniref:plasmid replication DNA-binding protein n=1 Tax=Acinetobacter TaxID=469 RepID=UPI000DE64C7A|nr:plasmid replication DNA-binding protein [Acinetobacter indicus]QIC75020.1 DNA-binding protein [Acinetobacter indicus]SSS86857.1 Putative helix-turn-helix protein, YlxM / p13 like protein [Acinetobacter baumannii]